MQLSGRVDFYVLLFGVVYATSRWSRQRNSIKLCANLGKSAMETPAMIRQAFREESMRRTRKVQTHRDRKRRDRWRAKSRACSSFSFISRRSVTNGTSVPQTAVMFHGDCMKLCEHFAPNFENSRELAVAPRQRTVSHFPFHQEIFDRNQHGCRPPPSLHYSVSRLKIKLKGRHFDTTEVMEA
jgi:hypothetical protein